MTEEWPLTAEWENVHPLYKKQINNQTRKHQRPFVLEMQST